MRRQIDCRRLFLLPLVLLLGLAFGCGGKSSSEPTEHDANDLLRQLSGVTAPICARVEGREFVCSANAEGDPVTVHATVSEDGESIVITDCDDEESIYNPCEALP